MSEQPHNEAGGGNRVLVTGASGFVGKAIIEELLSRKVQVMALVRSKELPPGQGLTSIRGDLFDAAALDAAVAGCRAVIHLVGIIREQPSRGVTFERIHVEGTKSIVEAATRAGVPRVVHMSAAGARPGAASRYHQTKYAAEEIVRSSPLSWTIFQPSLIHGPGGEFMQMEAGWAKGSKAPYLFMPYFGGGVFGRKGATHVQPVYVDDVARAFLDAIDNPRSVGRTYCLGGTQTLTWPQMHRVAAKMIVGKSRAAIPLPAWYATALTYVLPAALLPFNRDQIIMAREENVCDLAPFIANFGWTPKSFEESLAEYAKEM